MSRLLDKQVQFTYLLSKLIQYAYDTGYQLTVGEAYRSDEQAEINALGGALRERLADLVALQFPDLAGKIRNNVGSGIRTSLHGDRLAIDLNLFVNYEFQTDPERYRPLGEYWESLGGTWGGRFGDANHFSIAHEGRK